MAFSLFFRSCTCTFRNCRLQFRNTWESQRADSVCYHHSKSPVEYRIHFSHSTENCCSVWTVLYHDNRCVSFSIVLYSHSRSILAYRRHGSRNTRVCPTVWSERNHDNTFHFSNRRRTFHNIQGNYRVVWHKVNGHSTSDIGNRRFETHSKLCKHYFCTGCCNTGAIRDARLSWSHSDRCIDVDAVCSLASYLPTVKIKRS